MWARRSFPTYEFGEAFRGLFPMRADANAQFCIERIVWLSMGAVKVLFLEAVFEQMRGASGAPFSVALFREWTVFRGAPLLGQSVVVVGVPEHVTEQQVGMNLLRGQRGTFPR